MRLAHPGMPRSTRAARRRGGCAGQLAAAVYDALRDGTWSRLKACRKHGCLYAFYDRTEERLGRLVQHGNVRQPGQGAAPARPRANGALLASARVLLAPRWALWYPDSPGPAACRRLSRRWRKSTKSRLTRVTRFDTIAGLAWTPSSKARSKDARFGCRCPSRSLLEN